MFNWIYSNWKNILKWFLILLIIVILFSFAIKLFGCLGGCNSCKSSPSLALFKRGLPQQIKIDSLTKEVEIRDIKIDSLEALNHAKDIDIKILKAEKNLKVFEISTRTKKQLYDSSPVKPDKNKFDSTGLYCYDSSGQVSIEKTYAENDFLKQENNLLYGKDSNNQNIILNLKKTILDLKDINNLKDSQLLEFENRPVEVEKRKWYIDVAIVAGSVAVGFVIKSMLKK